LIECYYCSFVYIKTPNNFNIDKEILHFPIVTNKISHYYREKSPNAAGRKAKAQPSWKNCHKVTSERSNAKCSKRWRSRAQPKSRAKQRLSRTTTAALPVTKKDWPHEFYVKKSGSVDVKKGLLSERSEF